MRRVWGLRRDSRAVPKYMWPRAWSKLKFSDKSQAGFKMRKISARI